MPSAKARGKLKAQQGPLRSAQKAENDPDVLQKLVDELDPLLERKLFAELPLCAQTLQGLDTGFYKSMTPIQARSLGFALKGRDILGAARTGSGKTLAFLIPVLELLHRQKWSHLDGLGALIISPTRELAVQIFDVLRKIGSRHSFSAGLVIGGKSLKDEQDRLSRMNILIATPGRLLQHMDQTVGFEADNLQILILDEADRCLDMGFASCLNAVLSNLPSSRQTLLFSATQTKSVKDLARLSLKDPEYVAPKADNQAPSVNGSMETDMTVDVPAALEQLYMVVPLEQKIDRLWSFIKTHLQCKAIVFASSSKQVRFLFETMRHMRPGIPLMHLFGRQKQATRLDTYTRFSNSKHAILFATDVAARGLDFPAVDWVLQLDCPEDAATYIHRVGRTARYQRKGKALLFLCPSEEEGMVRRLKERSISVEAIRAKQSKQQSIQGLLQSYAFQYPEVKNLAQRAFISYVRSVYLQGDKGIFKLETYPLEAYATSLGLAGAPQIRFPSKDATSRRKNASWSAKALDSGSEAESEDVDDSVFTGRAKQPLPSQSKMMAQMQMDPQTAKTKYERMFKRKNQSVLAPHYTDLVDRTNGADLEAAGPQDEHDEFITLSRTDHDLDVDRLPESAHISKRKLKQGQSKKAISSQRGSGTKIVFNEAGEGEHLHAVAPESSFVELGTAEEQSRRFVEREGQVMREADIVDKQLAKDKKRERKRKRKSKERDAADADAEGQAILLPVQDDDGYISPAFEFDESDREATFQPSSYSTSKRPRLPHEESHNAALEDAALQALSRRR